MGSRRIIETIPGARDISEHVTFVPDTFPGESPEKYERRIRTFLDQKFPNRWRYPARTQAATLDSQALVAGTNTPQLAYLEKRAQRSLNNLQKKFPIRKY